MPLVFAQCIITLNKLMSRKTFSILNSVFWLSILKNKRLCPHYCECPCLNGPAWLLEEVSPWSCVGWPGETGSKKRWPCPCGQVFHSGTQALILCLRHLLKVGLCCLQSYSCGPARGSCAFIQDFLEIDLEKKVSKLCSDWIPCNTEVPWACLQCHPVGTGRAVLVLLGNAPWKTPLPAMVHWGVSDAIKHRAWEMKSPRKMWATLHLVLANKIGRLE